MRFLIFIVLLITLSQSQDITPYYVLPVQTTQNIVTSYSFLFYTDTEILSHARVAITFPKEFDKARLSQATRVRYLTTGTTLQNATWAVSNGTFTIKLKQISIGNITVVIDSIANPADINIVVSGYFKVATLFKDVIVSYNQNFGRVPFTKPPTITPGGTVHNYVNTFIEQGSSWVFNFTLAGSYAAKSSLRFIFPQGFLSNKIQCNVSGVIDSKMETRVLPTRNVYDCLNLPSPLEGELGVVLSGVVNPNYKMTASGFQVHVLQPNNMIILEIITSVSIVQIQAKPLNATIKIPNNYRNNSATYIFEINPDTNLRDGDYMVFTFTGLWNIFTNSTNIISGVTGDASFSPKWTALVNTSTSTTTLTLSNFSSISKTTQFTFFQPLVTPILPNTYTATISSYRFNGGLAQTYSQSILINQTTGYIREMKLHPMQRAVKLPVGMTGPLEIVLFLQNNLPQTNVLTYGKIVIQITPKIPAPIVSLNGVPKCYFYGTIPAVNCTFDSTSSPTVTLITIFTPANFNFQQSEVPLTITTEGYLQPSNQGITIDTLVKRYFFEIQFYSHLRPPPIPLEVIFDEWIPDSIPLTSLSCNYITLNAYEYEHLRCTFVTPTQVLNSAGHIHFFRVQFTQSSAWGWAPNTNTITPDYPCLMYGVNVSANPYVKCDYVTWHSGPYKSQQSSTSYSYITFYGLSTIPGGSTITFQIPQIQRYYNGVTAGLTFSILEDTPGYNSPIVYLYSQSLNPAANFGSVGGYSYLGITPTLSNSVINKVTSITLTSLPLGAAGVTQVIFQVDQTAFPNIGRGRGIACGSHICSKFDIPVQYFILYPSSTLGSSATLTFPSITTPPYAGSFTFYTRSYLGSSTRSKYYFYVTINPDTITDCSYRFSPLETVSTLYPNSDRFYTISWRTVNPVLSLGGNSYVVVTINNVFSLISTYCHLTTTALAYDGRKIFCRLSAGGTQVFIKNLKDMPAGTTFNLTVQMRSTATTGTVSPTVNIQTYYGNGALVDQVLNLQFTSFPLTNTNLTVFTNFAVPSAFTSVRAITSGYFGSLLINFRPSSSATVINGSSIILTMATGFYPAGNTLGLPLSCQLNSNRLPCTYTLNPFVITMTRTNSSFSTANNVINITTLYQNSNGIFFPSTGRYLLQVQARNHTTAQILERVQQYVDILPGDVAYFNVSWAHRDIGRVNIYTVQFKNGPAIIPAYNNPTNAGRIYIGFPIQDSLGNAVFASDLGYGLSEGSVLPCFFDSGVNFVTAISGRSLTCKIRMSMLTNLYHSWIEVINFAAIPAGAILRVIIGKVANPSLKQIDINFLLRVNTLAVSTNIQTPAYQTSYNMFFDMLTASITNRNQINSSSVMFQPGSTVGQTNCFLNITPYTGNTFRSNDWFIVDLDPQFPLSGSILNCLSPFYQYCIIYPTINWLVIRIGNGTIISLQPLISQLPISISRVDTTYTCYTFLSGRWSETITYTVTASSRWLEIRGAISGFSLQVLGSQNKLNVGQQNVQVLVSFTVAQSVPVGGSIEIRFPDNSTTVPAIKTHCRSAVSLGSALNGFKTGKPNMNVQGEVGCLVQNTYSWIVTGFDTLPAGSQVRIYGLIDLPTVATNSLGMGHACTYSNQDSANTFNNARTIGFLRTNFALAVHNLTWRLDTTMPMLRTQPSRVGYVGEFKFVLNMAASLSSATGGGLINVNLWQQSTASNGGGFNGPSTNLVCTILDPTTNYKYGCYITLYNSPGVYTGYRITTYQNLPANINLEFTITTQKGSGIEGINFPTAQGTYKVEIEVNYYTASPFDKNQAYYIDVYGPNFNSLFFNSTVTIPQENNFIMVIFTPSATIAINQQLIIEIPTVALDGATLFPIDLGMGYSNYDNLVFDLFQSDISAMSCKVFTGDLTSSQPVKIICSNFNTPITTSMTVKFGFWVVNPASTVSMAIPVQVYAFDQPSQTKFVWSIIEAGIRVLPVTVTPINDLGNWLSSSTFREVRSTSLSFTTRNTRAMVRSDWYILKFAFDLRNTANTNGSLSYNTNMAGAGDVIFMRNCQTILLRVGATAISIVSPGSITVNARINSLFYNPSTQLTAAQATILAYTVYNSADVCEKVIYRDAFPTLVPNEPSSPSFSITSVYSNRQMGMRDDFRFSFTMSSSAGNSTSLARLISIQFPALTTFDIGLVGQQCYEFSSSTIQVSSCVIDTANRVIWITPVPKASYTDNNPVIIQTAGLAIQNPVSNLTITVNQFVIRYYTWPSGQAQPSISAGSNDWCFMRQDSSNLPVTTISFNQFSSTYFSPHSFISFPNQVVVNEWEPADYYINNASTTKLAKSPFQFKMIAPTAFASLSGANYHTIALSYGSYYSTPTSTNTNDLYIYVPTCELNGRRVHICTINSNTITMSFQDRITNGAEITVKFSVINPRDQADEGFTLTTTGTGTVTMPIMITPSGGTAYYIQMEPFQPFYKATNAGATYPSMGISNVALSWGTQVMSQLNYLEFTITLSRNDINGLVLEIPIQAEDGTLIFNNLANSFLGLPSGSKYPCSMGIYAAVYCYFIQGVTTSYGTPARIYITGFSIPANNSLSFRMLFTNPDIQNVFPKFTFKAFGGSFSAPATMGDQLMGMFTLIDPFKIFPQNGYYSTGTVTCNPNKILYQTQTYYDCNTGNQGQPANTYAILEWPLVDPTYGNIGEYEFDSTAGMTFDHFFMSNEGTDTLNKMNIYIVKKLSSGSPSSYRFGYLRMKHHIVNSYTMYLLAKSWTRVYTASTDYGTVLSTALTYTQFTTDIIDVQSRRCNQWSWHYFALSTGAASSIALSGREPSEMVIEITVNGGQTWNALSSSHTTCQIDSGVIGNDPLNPVTCFLDVGNNKIIISNVYSFTSGKLQVFLYARMACSQSGFGTTVRLFANPQAHAQYNWPILMSTTSAAWTLNAMVYASANFSPRQINTEPSFDQMSPTGAHTTSLNLFNGQAADSGYVRVMAATTSSITVRLQMNTDLGFEYYTYRLGFRFYTTRLFPTSPCSSVTAWNSRHGNFVSGWWLRDCEVGDRMFYVSWRFYVDASAHQNQWPHWYPGDYTDFTFNFASVGADSNNNANEIFAQATVVWQNSYYYFNDQANCGCNSICYASVCCTSYTCYGWCSPSCFWDQCCNPTSCNPYCCNKNSCRWLAGYGYLTVTNLNERGWSQAANSLAQSISTDLLSSQIGKQTQYFFSITNLYCSLSTTMTNNNWYSSGQLVVSFTGDNGFANGNPFPYTTHTEAAAYIQCLCVVSSSAIAITSSTSYTAANCTRYVMAGVPPFITVRINANVGQNMRCFFPGFRLPSSVSSWSLVSNFYRDPMNHFKFWALPNQFRSIHQTTGISTPLSSHGVNGISVNFNNTFWTTGGTALQNKYYQLHAVGAASFTNPVLYMSTYSPQTVQGICNSGSYLVCRAYNSFLSRRYFLVVQANGFTSAFNLTANLNFPQSWEFSTSAYTTYLGMTAGGWSYYHSEWSGSLSQSSFSAGNPAIGLTHATFSNNLQYSRSLMSVSVQLNGFALYSNRRTQGPFRGSFARLTLSGFTSLNGCGVVVFNTPTPVWSNNALYCTIQSTTQINIFANSDIFFTGRLYITFQTDSVPASSTYTFMLYDKYYSSTNYGLAVSAQGSFSRTVLASFVTLQPTSMKWRRQAYKDIRNDAGPVKLVLNNNYQYVSTYNAGNLAEDNNSDGILVFVPGSGLTNTAYYCYLREYLPNAPTNYDQYIVNCQFYATNQVLVKSIPSHILTPNHHYQIIIYKNTGSGSSFITVPSAASYVAQVGTINAYSSGTIQYYDYIPVLNYLNIYPITLSSIYTLTREAAAINSLYLSFTISIPVPSSNIFYLELIFDSFDLNYFNAQNGDEIPCFLSASFNTYPGHQNPPKCYGFADGINKTTPLIVRVFNFAGFSSGTSFQLSLDNFNNPPINRLILVPINLRMSLVDRTNTAIYTSYFPNVYQSDSINIGVPANLGGSLSRSNNFRGATNVDHFMNLNWPYNSNSADVSQKIVMKIYGGITCCQNFASLFMNDSHASVYTLLWTNSAANTSVYVTPSKGVNTNTNWFIKGVNNPNQVNFQTYSRLFTVTFAMYSGYRTSYITTINQPAFSTYTINSDFVVSSSPSRTESTANFNFHSHYPLTYEFSWDLAANNYNNRNISHILLYFTNGVRGIDNAWFRYAVSPFFTNSVGNPKVGFDSSNSQWYVNITGVQDSIFSATFLWYVRVRLYASGSSNHIHYTSNIFNFNGNLQFSSSSGSRHLPSDGWSASSNFGTPTSWRIQVQRYTQDYFQLQRNVIYAAPSQTTNKLYYRFTAPYNMSQVESISLISSSTNFPAPTTLSDGIYCIIQPTFSTIAAFGTGLYAPCTYSSGIYSISIPAGGMTTKEYLLTIIGRRQLTTSFNMPTTPQRIEVSLIYNSMLNLQYGDVYTLDFAGMVTTYDMDHAALMSGQFDMLGFSFNPSFTLPAASTSAPVTESVLSFEIQSNYYHNCLNIAANVFNNDGMPFYSGVYYSHFSIPAVTNANTRILCGQNTQAQNWAPIKFTVTDYGAVTAGTNYYFRFPLVTLPTGSAVPLTYKVKLLQYSNGNAFPIIINQFSFENKFSVTNSFSTTNAWASLSLGSSVVQSTMSVSFSYSSFNLFWSGYETILKFKNNLIRAMTSITTLTSLSASGYSYQYYPNINLCSFIKNSNFNSYGFSLGTYTTSIDQQNFQFQFVSTYISQTSLYRAIFNSGVSFSLNTISFASSWTTSSFTKGTNILTPNSADLYTVSWMANYLSFPEGSYMILTFSTNFNIIDEYCYSYSGFIQGSNANSNLVCKRYSPTQILISGYAALAASASLSIRLYLEFANLALNSYSPTVNIVVYSSANNIIINANTNTLPFALSTPGGLDVSLSGRMTLPYTPTDSFPLYITFQLRTNTLVSGDYLQIDFGNWVLDTAAAGTQVFKYQLSGNIYWVPADAILVSGNIYRVPVYNNYSMTAGTQITLWVDTFVPTSHYGARVNSIQWNAFRIFAFKSAVLVQQQITRVWTEPYGHASFAASPALTYINVNSLWEFSVTPNVSASAGDTILMEFETHDQLNVLFSNNLGATIPSGDAGSFDCSQFYNVRVISATTIQCIVYAGDNTKTPPVPTTIAIPITLVIPANTLIRYNIFNILNPTLANYPMGVTFKLATPCSSQDSNNLCAYYKSITYLSFASAQPYPGYSYQGSLTFNPTRVSATNTLHTLSANFALQNNDFVRVTYYTQVPIPEVCRMSTNNGVCYSYPTSNNIIIKVNTTISSPYSIVLSGMTNPYQRFYGSFTFYTEIWRGGAVWVRFYSDYTASTITTDPTTGSPLTISFTPTLTPNYQLKYGFNNIANVTLTNMIQNSDVKQIVIYAPAEITIDTQYCNATMQTFPGEAKPYPYRFICQSMSATSIVLNMLSDFPAWNSATAQRSIYVYIRYTIHNSKTVSSNNWYAYAYADPSSQSSNFYVSYAAGNFPIVEYQLPYLQVINFPSKSFSKRTCAVGQQCMIYGFIHPTTPSSSIVINRMTFLLPKEFNYSSLQTFDNCFIQSTTTTYYQFSCSLTRNSSQITIAFNPTAYNQQYNLFNIDHSVSSMLFTAPRFPGNHYQMQVNLWSNTNTLVQSQYINLTTVYGYYLSVPLINFVIPLDASQKGLFDLTFTVGAVDILPSYTNSATYTITSAIQVGFANSFDANLGTGLSAGSEIACLMVSGLTFNIMKKITCTIYPSISPITYPTIIVTGYDRIEAGTVVRIRFANLKTLAAGITDYCTLGVSYTYFNYGGVKGYIYQPVSFVVGPTTAAVTPRTITYTISEISTNFVGQLSNYTLSGSIGAGFSHITPNDFFVVQFPDYVFEGRFHQNTQALCSLAAGNRCNVFGLAAQIYIQPSSTVSTSAFSFTIRNLLNAAFEMQYIIQQVTLFTVVNNKVNARGHASFKKFTRASLNSSAIITSIDSIYGGDSGINYYFSFQLRSYLPETGKISIFIPSIYLSLFTLQSACYLRADSQLAIGSQTYCQIINNHQLVIVPNGVLISPTTPYYFIVTHITNPNLHLDAYRFRIETYYSSNVYSPQIISRSQFSSPVISLITVRNCQLQINASIYNQYLPSQYQINLICPATIKQSSELKLYLSWNPSPANLSCSSNSKILYSNQCNIQTEFSRTTRLTYLSIFLKNIQAQKLVSITTTLPNGIMGTYSINSTINYNGFVYLEATSNSFYITGPSTARSATTLSVRSTNYPRNRQYTSIYTFAITNPLVVVSTLQIDFPSAIIPSRAGINCGYQPWNPQDNYFNLMMRDGTNNLNCNMTGQRLIISGLTTMLRNLSSTNFLYLTVNGLNNPTTSVSQSNFTFTFINTSSPIFQSAGIYTLPLSYPVSSPPTNLQIANISLSDGRYYVRSLYTFTITSAQSANLVIANRSNLGVIIEFPGEYNEIWQQITLPNTVNLTINNLVYIATNVTMKPGYLFARLPLSAFTAQVSFTSITISFNFRNPNKSLDCSSTPVFRISIFNFLTNSILAQTLSNNKICPVLNNRLFTINVTGNTKFPAGSSEQFIVTIQRPASYLAITPACTSSAISFTPSVIVFQDFKRTAISFKISAAIGLSGNFNITFSKTEGNNQKYYNDIQFTTLNIYIPTTNYNITVRPFSTRSIGLPIAASFTLQVASTIEFSITFVHNCNSNFTFSPNGRLIIPALTTTADLYVRYTGRVVPLPCQLNLSISSVTNNNFELVNPYLYISGKTSIFKSSNTPFLILELTTYPQNSTNVGTAIVSSSFNTNTSSSNTTSSNVPIIYTLNVSGIGGNSASFTAFASTVGTVYYVVLNSGTPTNNILQTQIYKQNISNSVYFGNSTAALNTSGVNIISRLVVTALKVETNYIIAAYLNSTVGISAIVYRQFSTSKASNGATITLAMSTPVDIATLLAGLSNVWRIPQSRISLLTPTQTLSNLQNTFRPTLMNNRSYVYEIVLAPDVNDDSTKPIDLLDAFLNSTNDMAALQSLIPQYIITYNSNTREIIPSKPRVRSPPQVTMASHDTVKVEVKFWEQAYVYGVIIRNPTNRTLSSQVIKGYDANNRPLVSQHYAAVTSDRSGVAVLTFNLLADNSSYTIFISASCVLPFVPRISLSDSEVVSVSAKTMLNLSLQKNQDQVVNVIKDVNPVLAEKVRIHIERVKAAAEIQGGDRSSRRRER